MALALALALSLAFPAGDSKRVVFVDDETGCDVALRREYARCRGLERSWGMGWAGLGCGSERVCP